MWFTETAWPPIIALAIGAAILLAMWSTSRGAFNLLGAILLILGCGVVYLIEQRIVTERERVEASVFGVADAFRAADTGRTLEYISPRAIPLRVATQWVMDGLEVRVQGDLRITDVDVEMLSEETRARSHFRANGSIFSASHGGDVGHQPTRWNVTWQKEAGEWRIIDVERLDPVRGDPMELVPGMSASAASDPFNSD